MTQEDKELLLRDLSARVTYEVKAYVKNWSNLSRKYYEGVYTIYSVDPSLNQIYASKKGGSVEVILGHSDYVIKPFLRPMSSMTEEEQRTLDSMCNGVEMVSRLYGLKMFDKAFDWLNKNHFDYRGLIEKGLAIDATGLDVY